MPQLCSEEKLMERLRKFLAEVFPSPPQAEERDK
jgi:hypothetical protein